MPTFGLEHPAALLLLIPAAALGWWDARRRRTDAAAAAGVHGVGARLAVMSCLVLALAGPRCTPTADAATIVFVLDRSASIADQAWADGLARIESLRRSSGAAHVGLVLFDAAPEVAVIPGAPWTPPPARRAPPAPDGSDPAAAVRAALALLPPQAAGQVVLLTDARATAGDLARAADDARRRGVRVHVVALDQPRRDPAITSLALAAGDLRPGATLKGRATVDGGGAPVRARLIVEAAGRPILTQDLALPAAGAAGPLEVPFSYALDPVRDRGAVPVTARLTVTGTDADPTNNQARVEALVGDAPRVLVLAGVPREAAPLARVLKAEGMAVDLRDLKSLAGREPELDGVELVLLVNAPAVAADDVTRTMPARFVRELRGWVSRGGGLVVVGGDRAFNLGGYARAGLGDILPVDLDPRDKSVDSSATVVIILDRSGSMTAPAGGGKTKMQLTDEGAVASLRMLRPFDSVGVMSVDSTVHWNVPMRKVGDREGMDDKVLSVTAGGGGIYVYTSLEAARVALRGATTPLRHVILFSDAADAEEQFKGNAFARAGKDSAHDLARAMHADGVTTSVIGIGTNADKDTAFLRELAVAGGGRFHITADAAELKSLFVQETQQLLDSALHEKPFRARVVRRHPIIDGAGLGAAPALRGYVELVPRRTAEVILEGPKDDPLLAVWRYGLGQVAVFASDAGLRWAAPWVSWRGYDRFWTQLARFALRRHEGDDAALDVRFDGTDARLTLARRTASGLSRDTAAHATLVQVASDGTESEAQEIAVVAREPGTWEAALPTRPGGRYRLRLDDGDGHPSGSRSFVAPPSGELARSGADRALLATVARRTGGEVDPARIAPDGTRMPDDPRPLAPLLLALGALLAPVDAWLRRGARAST